MPSYDNIDDEEELHKILSKTDDFEERKKIRNRMRELREKKSKEMEEKRLQREKETEDIFKKKFQAAEEEQKRQMKAFEKAAQETKEEREKILKVKDDILKESIKAQDEAKKRQLEAFDKMAQKGGAQPAGAKGAMNKFKEMDTPPAGGAKPNFAAGRGGGRPVTRSPSAIKEMLLNWTKAMTAGYENVDVQNFSSSWNNGMAFCALIHHFYPDAFDFSKLDPKKRRANFQLAFDMAEKHADIAPLLDVEDMVKMQKPDWKCVFTYVQSFYRKLNDHPRNSAGAPKSEQ